MATAAQKVFLIPELLEQIILQLRRKDILILQRVNRAFMNAVERCGDIQRKLFLSQPLKADDGLIHINPLISSALRYHGIESRMIPMRYQQPHGYGAPRPFDDIGHPRSSKNLRIRADEIICPPINYIGRPVFAADLQKYKQMLIADKPVRFRIGIQKGVEYAIEDFAITTLGQLVDACWQAMHEAEGLRGENVAWRDRRWW